MEDDSRPRDSRESIKAAVKRGKVSFSQQFAALYAQYEPDLSDQERADRVAVYEEARHAFEEQHEGVERSFYANEFAAGAALMADDTLHDEVWFDTLDYDTSDASALRTALRTLKERIGFYLEHHPRDRRVCLHGLFDLLAALISGMRVEFTMHTRDGNRTPTEEFRKNLGQIAAQRADLELRYLAFARTHAQRRYLAGAALGTIATAVIVGIIWWLLDATDTEIFQWVPVMAAGAIGSLLSVLQRNASGTLEVQVEADRRDLTIGGMTRPLVGVLSALAVYVLVEGGIVPLELPTNEPELRFFFAGIGFLAGFSERFVKDAFGKAEGMLA
jgi:hypothetical protein